MKRTELFEADLEAIATIFWLPTSYVFNFLVFQKQNFLYLKLVRSPIGFMQTFYLKKFRGICIPKANQLLSSKILLAMTDKFIMLG